ncbi:MAG: hypothetical protein HYY44_05340, partial [Deltaproteobacteria bacterium]|nr:hypothetical protein [Deltaproteobacteria bacterium]
MIKIKGLFLQVVGFGVSLLPVGAGVAVAQVPPCQVSRIAGGGSFPLNELGYRESRPAREVSFSPPTVLDVDRDGNLYFSFSRGPDHMDHLYRISTDGQVSNFMDLDGGATALTIDPGNNLYVAVDFNRSGRTPRSAIIRVSPDGSQTLVAGNGLGPPPGTEPMPALEANIDTYIVGLAAGPSGDLFFG